MEESFSGKKKGFSKITAAVFVVALLAMIFRGSIGGFVSESFGISQIEARPSFSSTLEVAKNTLANSPGFGSGPNRFSIEWSQNKPIAVNQTVFWNVDFSYGVGFIPTTLITSGVLGFVSWILFLGAILILGIRMMFRSIEDMFSRFVDSIFFLSNSFPMGIFSNFSSWPCYISCYIHDDRSIPCFCCSGWTD